VGQDGAIDRKVLGALVFNDPQNLELLQGIVWPEVEKLLLSELKRHDLEQQKTGKPGWLVLEAALLLESSWDAPDKVILYCRCRFHCGWLAV